MVYFPGFTIKSTKCIGRIHQSVLQGWNPGKGFASQDVFFPQSHIGDANCYHPGASPTYSKVLFVNKPHLEIYISGSHCKSFQRLFGASWHPWQPRIFFCFFVGAISDMILYLVHWVLFREALRLEQNVVAFSKQVGNFTCAHTFQHPRRHNSDNYGFQFSMSITTMIGLISDLKKIKVSVCDVVSITLPLPG